MERMLKGLFIVAIFCHSIAGDPKPFVMPPNSDLESFHTYSPTGSSNYVTLTLGNDSETLYIGGKDIVFATNARDITKRVFEASWPVAKTTSSCRTLPQSDGGRKCHNLIQIVQPINDTYTLICGTNNLDPQNRVIIRENGSHFVRDSGRSRALCSYDPEDSITSVILPGNDGSNIFSTSRPQFKKISLIKGMPTSFLREKAGSDKTTFVASFAANDTVASPVMLKVYVVSDEKGNDLSKPPAAPTITQLCANDIGGDSLLPNQWTSLLKVRLQCQTADQYPLVFDLVTDVVKGRDGIVYGTFTTRHDTARSNAVCAFRLHDIQYSFNNGDFWKSEDRVPKDLRPGMCAYRGMNTAEQNASTSKDFPNTFLDFMSRNSWIEDIVKPAYPPSMDGTLDPLSKGPLFIKSGDKFTKIAVEQVTSLDGVVHDLIFVAKESGHIHKFLTLVKGKSLEVIELAQYQPTNDPIISMKHSQKLGQLYIGTENSVYQLSTTNCAAYTMSCEFCDACSMCILSRDPGCAWDSSSKLCVPVKGNPNRPRLLQDVYHGNAVTLCSKPKPAKPSVMIVTEGDSEVLGKIIENPTIQATWYKVKDSTTKQKIANADGKFKITTDGQLEITNFDPSKDSATYECQYTANVSIVSIVTYNVKAGYSPPSATVTVPPRKNSNNGDGNNGKDTTEKTGNGITDVPETTSFGSSPVSQGMLEIGLVVALCLVVALVIAMVACFLKRRRKYTPGQEAKASNQSVVSDGTGPMSVVKENANNNNTATNRGASVNDDRPDRPLLGSREHQTPGYSDVERDGDNKASSSQTRNAKSLDNILDGRDEIEFIDEDSASGSGVTRQNSLRETTGRTRVPPQRTKSMPGSAFYVVYAGKKLMCSTLQRNKQGTWTVELQPNQSGMSDMTTEQDDVIDIINDSEHSEMFLPSPNAKSTDKSNTLFMRSPAADSVKDARKTFFEGGGGKPGDDNFTVQYVTSTPNNSHAAAKPEIAPKPARLMSDRRKPVHEEQKSRASLRSFGQNSSEDRDSDSTVKGSSITLKPDETPPSSFVEGPSAHKHRHHKHHQNRQHECDEVQVKNYEARVPVDQSNKKKRSRTPKPSKGPRQHANANSFDSSAGSLDRSCGSSDGADEQLHGRDKNVKRKKGNMVLDSPSKQSRTSQGSSSSGDYRSARSSVISEQSHEHR